MFNKQDAIHVWKVDVDERKMTQTSINLGKIRRNITSLMVSHMESCKKSRVEIIDSGVKKHFQ